MGPAVVQYRFARLPSAFRYFPRAVFGRRMALVPDGDVVPRLEGRVEAVRASRRHLARYRDVCGFADDGCLPLTYPHVLAMPLHFAILTHPRFVVRLMGLVHVANDIHQKRPLPASGRLELRSWIEGHRDVDRGHEFDLFTSAEDGHGTAWLEKSTLLARRSAERQAGRCAGRARRFATRSRPRVRARDCRHSACRVPWVGATAGCPAISTRFTSAIAARGCLDSSAQWRMACGPWHARSRRSGRAALAPPVHATVEFKFPLFMPGVRLASSTGRAASGGFSC